MLGASRIRKDAGVNTRRSAVGSNVVLLVVAIVVVVVLVVLSSFFAQRLALGEFIHISVFLLVISFNTVIQSLLGKTCVQAIFIVVLVVVVVLVVAIVVVVVVVSCVGIVVLVVVPVFAVVLAHLAGVLTFVLTRFSNGLLVCLDELSHLNNVLSPVVARAAAVVRAKLELGNEVASKAFFAFKHRNRSASIKLEGGVGDP